MRVRGTYRGRAIKLIAFSCLSICLLGSAQTGCGQTVNASLAKAQALKTVKVSSVKGWKEVISDKCRFRVLFPSEPALKPSDEVVPLLEGYKLTQDETDWAAQYVEFDEEKTDDEQLLREAYRGSAEAMGKNRGRLLKQSDVILNGRLGTEFIIEERNAATYMRVFLIGQHMYTLTVVRKKVAPGSSTFPQDVQQFFDSFTFWD